MEIYEQFFSVIENKLPYRIVKTDIKTVEEARKALFHAQKELGEGVRLAIRKESLIR